MKRNEEYLKEQFTKDIANHKMTIRHDDDIYRHIVFKNPKDSRCWFELITWPYNLTISGDMGTYTFTRVEDMFQFFSGDINPDYWAEKCRSYDSRCGLTRYDIDVFKKNILSALKSYSASFHDKEYRRTFFAKFREEVWGHLDEENEYDNTLLLGKFDSDYFEDSWGYNNKVYTYNYLWGLYAIVWGIEQYNNCKTKK
jgi:hypothetical protein